MSPRRREGAERCCRRVAWPGPWPSSGDSGCTADELTQPATEGRGVKEPPQSRGGGGDGRETKQLCPLCPREAQKHPAGDPAPRGGRRGPCGLAWGLVCGLRRGLGGRRDDGTGVPRNCPPDCGAAPPTLLLSAGASAARGNVIC